MDAIYAEAKAARRRGDVERAAELAFEATQVDATMGPPFAKESTREQAEADFMEWGMRLSDRRLVKVMEGVNRRLGLDSGFGSDPGYDSDPYSGCDSDPYSGYDSEGLEETYVIVTIM